MNSSASPLAFARSVHSRACGDEGVMTADAYVAKLKAEVATRALPDKKKA